jgi:DNA-binding NtrC family response regulator
MKVLIADDNLDFCTTIADIVTGLGFQSDTVQSPRDAMNYLDKNFRSLSILFLDIEFGPSEKLSGLDILEYSRRKFPSIPVVMISGKGTIETAVRATKLGAINFIEKSIISAEKIKAVLDTAVEKIGSRGEEKEILNFLEMHGIIGKSKAILQIGDSIIRYGRTDLNILITGETGTGKKLVAKAIHAISRRNKSAFVTVDIPNIPKEIFQSELFGHIRGAFTGASENKKGLFQQANKGTLFLDEIGDMSVDLQVNLLNPVEEKRVRKVGAVEFEDVDVRFVSATDRDLISAIKDSKFREQLYHRLRECEIHLPSLKERIEDIEHIVAYFQMLHNQQFDEQKFFSQSSVAFMMEQPWNGNIRELASVVRVALQTSKSDSIEVNDLHKVMQKHTHTPIVESKTETTLSPDRTLREDLAQVDKKKIEDTLERCNGNVSKSAAALGVSRETLHHKIRRYGIQMESFRKSSKG